MDEKFLDGRILSDSLRTGDVFTWLFDSESVSHNDALWTELTPAGQIYIVVEAIEMYGQSFDEMSQGAGCRLTVTGATERVRALHVLGNEYTYKAHLESLAYIYKAERKSKP